MKRIVTAMLAITLVLTAFNLLTFAESPKAISTYKDLCNIANDLNGSYYLTNDIDASGEKSFTPLGSASQQFKGTLDGKGYSIKNLKIGSTMSSKGSSKYTALIAYNGGTIKNLNLVGVSAEGGNAKYAYTAAFVAVNLATIENCYVSGTVRSEDVEIASYTAGVSAQMLRGDIKNCVSYVNVYAKGGEQYTGGITGYNEKGNISNTAMYGSVFANGVDASTNVYCGGINGFSRNDTKFTDVLYAGGIIAEKFSNVYMGGITGNTLGTINNAVAIGTVTPSQILSHIYIGAIAGNDYGATVENTYYLEGIINETITCKTGTGVTEKGLSNAGVYSGLNFSDTWEFVDGKPVIKGLTKIKDDTAISTLVGIKIDSLPKKLEYVQGDAALDLTGLKVSAIYTNKTVLLEQNEYTVGGYNYVTKGKQTITVSYKGFSETFTINVKQTDKGVVVPEITEDSYFDGDSTGDETNKPESKPTSSKDTASSTSSRNEINASEDTMEDDDDKTNSTTSSKGNDSKSTDTKKENTDGTEKDASKDKSTETASNDASGGDSSKDTQSNSADTSTETTSKTENTEFSSEEKDGSTVTTIGGVKEPTNVKVKLSTAALILIIAGAVVIVAGASALIVFYVKNKKSAVKTEAQEETKTE